MTDRWRPNVTVAAIIEHGGRYLLVEERVSGAGMRLNNPAGHLDQGESLLDAVVRETLEETACVFTPDRLVGIYMARFQRPAIGQDITYLRFAFGGTVGEPDLGRALDTPIVRTLWMTLDEVRASRERHRSELLLACIEDHAAGRRYPLDAITSSPTLAVPQVFAER